MTKFEIDLPEDAARILREKVASGEYASESEVVAEGLMSLQESEAAFEHDAPIDPEWAATIRERYASHLADPEAGRDMEEVFDELLADLEEPRD